VTQPTSTTGPLGGAAAQGEIVETDALTDAGFSDPEATIRTFFWAARQGALGQFQACYSPPESERLGKTVQEHREEFVASLRTSWAPIRRYRIVSKRDESRDRVVVKLAIEFQDGHREPEDFTLRRYGDGWKLDADSKRK